MLAVKWFLLAGMSLGWADQRERGDSLMEADRVKMAL